MSRPVEHPRECPPALEEALQQAARAAREKGEASGRIMSSYCPTGPNIELIIAVGCPAERRIYASTIGAALDALRSAR